MPVLTIRNAPLVAPAREADLWLMRAARARRIAWTLSRPDAEIALAHAAECEAEAARLVRDSAPLIAA
jgi:hypothetical protein